MGLIKQGILGGFRKKTGTVVGAYWRRLDVIRALPRNSGKAPTQKQINQQIKFGLVTAFLSNISGLIDVGFKSANETATPMNMAVSYHLKEAIMGVEPDFGIDLTKLAFSMGKLELPLETTVVPAAGSILNLAWPHTEADDKLIDGTDVINVLAYNASKEKFIKVAASAPRSAMAYSFQLPANFVGDEVQVYFSFSSTIKQLLQSKTVHLGAVTII
ncbi:MAG: hypothetical protein EOO42_00930 [Flavobacteriales bacterium]|nr:MAG: hypothetical protein EOO42_00930 [Flavobacteriales bacterium]